MKWKIESGRGGWRRTTNRDESRDSRHRAGMRKRRERKVRIGEG